MIAAFPMYDRPETRAANDRLWELFCDEYQGDSPARLSRPSDLFALWTDPDLLIAQTCGLPFRAKLHDKVRLVGTPIYDLDCPPGYYYSVIIMRADDMRDVSEIDGIRLAINDPLSQSGWAAPKGWLDTKNLCPSKVIETGAHRNTAKAVADGQADIAGIDALTWAMMEKWDDFVTNLKVIAKTEPTPALPYITAPKNDPFPVRAALHAAIDALDPQDRKTLGLVGLTEIATWDYLAQPVPPAPDALG